MPRYQPTTGAIALLRRDWIDLTRTLQQDCATGVCQMTLSDGTVLPSGPHADTNADAQETAAGAGLGVWLREQDATVYASDGRTWPGATVQRSAVGPDGAFALKRARNSFGPWDIVDRSGQQTRLTDGDAREIQLLGGAAAIYMLGTRVCATPSSAVTLPAEPAYGGLRATLCPPLNRYLLIYQRSPDGALVCDGHVVAPPGDYFYPDVRYADGVVRIVWASTQADADSHEIVLTLEELAALPVSPSPPPALVYPTFAFSHPVILAPFFAAGSGLPDLESLQADGRHIEVHDGSDDWLPPSTLRPYDMVLRELYWTPPETLSQFIARCLRQVGSVLTVWLGDVGVAPMFYDQLRWTEQQMLDAIAVTSQIVNLSPRVKVIAPFAYNRANGIIKYASLRQALASLRAAAQAAGLATLTPVQTPPTPPTPISEGSFVMAASQIMGIIHYASKKASNQTGCWNYILPNGRVFSCQADGSAGDRDPGTDGPWEEEEGDGGQEETGIATFHVGGAYWSYLAVKVDKLPS